MAGQNLEPQKLRAIICDIDGTLALLGDRSPFDTRRALEDALNHPIANLLDVYANQTMYDVRLILLTGREEKYRHVTEQWLAKHGVHFYEALYMRPNGDKRADYDVKREYYEQHIRSAYDVLFVLEDRDRAVKMWRDIGLTCLQVEYGNF